MIHIVSFSTGLSSALTAERVLHRYGKDATEIVAMDTLCEDEDNWRFARDCQARWGKEIVILRDGRDPYQVAEDKNIIPNQRIAPCTFVLKINLFTGWLEQFRDRFKQYPQATVHIGYDYAEAHRCKATTENYNRAGWIVDFPLLWKPYPHQKYSEIVRGWGIEPPRTYGMGFKHANCLKKGCVKMGQGDWLRLYLNFPDRYAITEEWEQSQREHPIKKNYAILRSQSNGTVTPLTLKELREQHEAGRALQPSLLDRAAVCVYCGVGDFLNKESTNAGL